MKLEQEFDVKAPVETVWATLIDVERVAPCLPGAEITGSEDGVYQGNFQVKIGPTTASYRGQLEMQSLDAGAHVATMKARGQDKRGQGSANATIVSSLSAIPDGTHVEVVTDFTITGTLARFGRGGMMQDIANRLLRDFAACLEQRLGAGEPEAASVDAGTATPTAADAAPPAAPAAPAAPAQAPPVKGISLLFSVFWERIKRLFKRD
jgi:carbon monoxide dehydrogenase subunit G